MENPSNYEVTNVNTFKQDIILFQIQIIHERL